MLKFPFSVDGMEGEASVQITGETFRVVGATDYAFGELPEAFLARIETDFEFSQSVREFIRRENKSVCW